MWECSCCGIWACTYHHRTHPDRVQRAGNSQNTQGNNHPGSCSAMVRFSRYKGAVVTEECAWAPREQRGAAHQVRLPVQDGQRARVRRHQRHHVQQLRHVRPLLPHTDSHPLKAGTDAQAWLAANKAL